MWVIVLALVSAVLSAVSAAGEQRAASRLARSVRHRRDADPPDPAPWRRRIARAGRLGRRRVGFGAAFLLALVASPLWLSSWALDATAFVTQATALHIGSISAVQPLMVTTLLFALPLAALSTGRGPGIAGWGGAVMICVGLVLVLSTRALPATETTKPAPLLVAMGTVVVLASALVVAGRGRAPVLRAALLSVAAGSLFAVGAAITKLAAATFLDSGLTGLLTSWPGYTLAAVSLASFSLQQAAYASGPLAPAITAVVITDPLVAYVLGAAGFGETLPHSAGSLAALVGGAIILGLGVALLARSPLLARRIAQEPERPRLPRRTPGAEPAWRAVPDAGRTPSPSQRVVNVDHARARGRS